ncbi:MAG: VOC family protein, partial [Actinobacteria bacterium]|nr:VOC family protein [Actinomycetota bacterium]
MKLKSGVHHVAYACRDAEATRHFYEDILGFPLVHTEVTQVPDSDSNFRHLFFDLGDGTCIAFFDLHNMGEKPDWRSDVSTGNGLPVWVNHIAFTADKETQEQARASLEAAGIKPFMDVDHGWCHSHY